MNTPVDCPRCGAPNLPLESESSGRQFICRFCQHVISIGVPSTKQTATDETVLSSPGQDQIQQKLPSHIGRYRILSELGHGGTGAVYKAVDEMLRRVVALKVLKQDLTSNAEFIGRCRRQMAAVGRLDHPNIVRAFDAGESGGRFYVATEYVAGQDLHQYLASRGRLPLHVACDFIRQAALGLQQAHENRLVHRDIKPSHLLLSIQGQVKILDLGLAWLSRIAGEDGPVAELSHETCLGTPDYMAPEQWESLNEVDGLADLYSLGCTLFALLAGRPPFAEATTIPAKAVAHMRSPAPDVRRFAPEVPAAVAVLINRLLAKERDQRPASAAEVATILSPFCRPIAPPANAPESSTSSPPKALREIQPLASEPKSLKDILNSESVDREHELNLSEALSLINDDVSADDPADASDATGCSIPMASVAGPEKPGRSESSRKLDENVQFTVYRPHRIGPDKWYPLLAFAHLDKNPPDAPKDQPDPLQEVRRQAARVLGPQAKDYANTTQDSLQAVPREGELTFIPQVEGIEFNPRSQTVLWLEPVHRVEFRMKAHPVTAETTRRGRVSIFLGAIILADVPIRITVGETAPEATQTPTLMADSAKPYRKIFASYSHKDLEIVEQFEHFVQTLGDRYLRDWRELRSGENWNDRLLRMIEEADVFQLFWSQHSMRSEFVRREWVHAISLTHKGPGFIRPTYWEDPFPKDDADNLPPPELLQLHFTKLGQMNESAPEAVAAPPNLAEATSGYYIQSQRTGKVVGPFTLEQLKDLRRRGQLSQFHNISLDRHTWNPCISLAQVFVEYDSDTISEGTATEAQTEPKIDNGHHPQRIGSGPVKFRCIHCRQLLGISRKKMGQTTECPTCGRTILVPTEDGDARTAPAPVMRSVRFDQNPNPAASREAMWVTPEAVPTPPPLPSAHVPVHSLPPTHRGAKPTSFAPREDDDLGTPVPLLDPSPFSDLPNQGAWGKSMPAAPNAVKSRQAQKRLGLVGLLFAMAVVIGFLIVVGIVVLLFLTPSNSSSESEPANKALDRHSDNAR